MSGRVPAGDVPAGDVPAGDVPAGDVPAGDVPAGDVPAGDAPPGRGSPPDRIAAAGRQLGAVALAVLLLGVVVLLLPGSARMNKPEVWKTPLNQAQFESWARALDGVGVSVSPERLEEFLWDAAQRYDAVRRPLLNAVYPVSRQLGVAQNWNMFSNPQTHPGRLHIEIDDGKGFEPVYVSRSKIHRWRGRQLDHNRMRKVMGRIARSGEARTRQRFVEWMTGALRRDFPAADRARLRLFRWRTPAPEEPTEPFDASGRFITLATVELRHR